MKVGADSKIFARDKEIGIDVEIGKDVLIECNKLVLGDNVKIEVETE